MAGGGALGNIIGLAPVVLGTGLVLWELGAVEKLTSGPGKGMNDYKIKSVQEMI